MKKNLSEEPRKTIIVHLLQKDFDVLEKYRGDLSVDTFFELLLRMIDSGAIQALPPKDDTGIRIE